MTGPSEKQFSNLEHTLRVGGFVAACFFGFALIWGAVLIFWPKPVEEPVPAPVVEPIKAFTDEEIRTEILGTLGQFLAAETTAERIKFVMKSDGERAALANYYEGRGNRDLPVESVNFVKPATVGGRQLWIVSYLDTGGGKRLLSFEREGNRFLLHWSPSYAYGELSWKKFAERKPSEPTAMRAFLLHHDGPLPPGYDAGRYSAFLIEDKEGGFTGTALMDRDAEGFLLLEAAPEGARLPVNIELFYSEETEGRPHLMIHRLLHFQWLGSPGAGKGEPLRRDEEEEIPNFRLVPN